MSTNEKPGSGGAGERAIEKMPPPKPSGRGARCGGRPGVTGAERSIAAQALDLIQTDGPSTQRLDFHSLRRSYNTALARAGVNVQQAMALAGHKSPQTHMVYVQLAQHGALETPAAALPALLPANAVREKALVVPIAISAANNDQAEMSGDPTGNRTCPEPSDRGQKAAIGAGRDQPEGADRTRNPAIDSHGPNPSVQTPGPAPSPRADLVRALTAAIDAATRAGDLHAARVAHEALGRLLAEPEPGAPTVADLASERAKRGK
jgi:hypothetical protein